MTHVIYVLVFSVFSWSHVAAILYAHGGPVQRNSLKEIPSRAPAQHFRYEQNTIDNSIGNGRFLNPRLQSQQNYRYGNGNQYSQVNNNYQPYGVPRYRQFQYPQQDRRSRQTYNSMRQRDFSQRKVDPIANQFDSEFMRPINPDSVKILEQIENGPKPIDGTKFRLPRMPGIAEITLCSNNTVEGRRKCQQNCRGSVRCLPSGCFCALNFLPPSMQVDSSESRAVRINPFTKTLYELPKTTPLHTCGENTLEGSQSCRNTCAEKGDIIVCVTDLCYCNLRRSAKNILEMAPEDRDDTKPTRTYDEKYPPKQVSSSWECAIGTDDNSKVFAHEKCIRECFAMKAHNKHGGVMLTCDPGRGKCKCISFLTLTKTQLKMELVTKFDSHGKEDHTTAAPVPCYGYACLIKAQIDAKLPGEALSQRAAENYAFCGPNSELGFTKCRDVCTYEKKGVVRCAGHSCYCHFGGIPFFKDGKINAGGGYPEDRAREVNIHTTRRPGTCRGWQCIDQVENAADIPPSFRICGFNNEVGLKKCQGECQIQSKGYIKCAGHACYCQHGSGDFINNIMKPGAVDERPPYNRKVPTGDAGMGMNAISAPFRSRFVFCGKVEATCQGMCVFIGDVVCGRLGCYCDSGL